MARPMVDWALCSLCRLAERDPQRGERILEALWEAHPRLLGELGVLAVDYGEVSIEEAAAPLGLSVEEMQSRVEAFRRAERPAAPIVEDEETGLARLAEGHVPVWEVVREFRRSNSLDELAKAYPALTGAELGAALAYGEDHHDSIQELIERYEEMQGRKRAEYPFAN